MHVFLGQYKNVSTLSSFSLSLLLLTNTYLLKKKSKPNSLCLFCLSVSSSRQFSPSSGEESVRYLEITSPVRVVLSWMVMCKEKELKIPLLGTHFFLTFYVIPLAFFHCWLIFKSPWAFELFLKTLCV